MVGEVEDPFDAAVAQCGGDFGLPLLNTWLSFGLHAVFLLLSLQGLASMIRRSTVARIPGVLHSFNLATGTAYSALAVALLALTVNRPPGHTSQCALASSVLRTLGVLSCLALSYCWHFKNRRPSSRLCLFLFVDLISNIARCQGLWTGLGTAQDRTFAAVFTAFVTAEATFLGSNLIWKSRWLLSWEGDEHSPEETASIFSLGLYSWINPLLWAGYHRNLSLQDLYPLDKTLAADAVSSKSLRSLHSADAQAGDLDVLLWAVKPLLGPLLLPVLPRLCLVGFTLCQPFFLRSLLNFLAAPKDEVSRNSSGSGLVGAAILIYVGIAASTSIYWYYQERAQSILRAFLVTCIYQSSAGTQTADGMAAVTLMSTDVDRIYTGMRYMHEVWANMIQTAVACWLLQRELGLGFLGPLVVVMIGFAMSFVLSKLAVKYQRLWMGRVQKRISITSSVLSCVKELRISALTDAVIDIVQGERRAEIRQGAKSRTIRAVSATLSSLPQAIAPVVAFAFGPGRLDTTKAFTSLSYLTLLTAPLLVVLQTLPIVASCWACLRRIYDFLARPPSLDPRVLTKSDGGQTVTGTCISVRNGEFGWSEHDMVLKGVNLTISPSTITFVTGPVASGKSTLCKALLGEVPFIQGDVSCSHDPGRIAYCAQVPFLLSTSIRNNILGFASFNTVRYHEVIHATMLTDDFRTLPRGDLTLVGSNGTSLSGGQKQRISLARALYHDADLIVFDDVFSGLDPSTQEQVCRRVFGPDGLVRKRRTTVVLCTQSVKFVPVADYAVELGGDGSIAKQGPVTQPSRMATGAVFLPADSSSTSPDVDNTIAPLHDQQRTASPPRPVDEESPHGQAADDEPAVAPPAAELSVYWAYMASVGIRPLALYVLLIICIGFCQNFSAIWLKFWSASTLGDRGFGFYIGIYSLLAIAALLVILSAGLIVLRTFVRLSGVQLHDQTLKTALHASLRFITTTDTGTILNLFSQDMTIIDSQLPGMINNLCISGAIGLGQAIVIAASSAYLAISYPFFIAVVYFVQKYYLPTSKRLRILDLEAKSTLYTHFLDTIVGIATIRSYGWFEHMSLRNAKFLDMSQRPSYQLAMVQQWLLLVMNMVVAALALILVLLATQLRGGVVDLGALGAAMVMLITFGTTLAGVVNAYTGLEIALGGISRLKTFSEITESEEKEFGEGDIMPPAEWPLTGKIVMEDISASYNRADPQPLLSDLSLVIHSREKVALCGRTGSGKSSVLALLLRLLDPITSQSASTPPTILVDDIPLTRINHSALRMHLIAASQDAVFLPTDSATSFRANLDPWRAATAEEALAALDTVGLREAIDARGGIDAVADTAGLSGGQKQLFCLARVVLRRRMRLNALAKRGLPEGGILLLDEMTSSVDRDTERLMMDILWREFEAYTVLMVTHSMEVAEQCDRVLVLDKGSIVEDGNPKELTKAAGSWFRALALAGDDHGMSA
ncbi:P-loop containing nucleoside triphosphate hydrolase protein [Coniochaeta ligniaria NRRL 30616]|uniref:p-loop containing nucleoside triphosphate hydrolase protein n=1 Tax=Coniochaeta ligniaria NRRL 30616 TaxID=1408157 RepID=A0A1J7JCV2_9PEZI|nr:P-loop containing nucleoside triphosphate hydrolase protein [Coniochaeta ligniaria NRRL 30616]